MWLVLGAGFLAEHSLTARDSKSGPIFSSWVRWVSYHAASLSGKREKTAPDEQKCLAKAAEVKTSMRILAATGTQSLKAGMLTHREAGVLHRGGPGK